MRWPWGSRTVHGVPVKARSERSADEVMAQVNALELRMIKYKLMDAEHGKGWSIQKAETVERKYKRFLYLSWKHRGKSMVPTEDIDEFWHYHILDTQRYPADCMKLFGYVIHHFPYLGIRGAEDAKALRDAFAETCSIYERELGEPYVESTTQPLRYAACGNEADVEPQD